MVAAMAILGEEATNLTLSPLKVLISYQVQGISEIKGGHQWLTGRYLNKYQVFLLDFPDITLKDTKP